MASEKEQQKSSRRSYKNPEFLHYLRIVHDNNIKEHGKSALSNLIDKDAPDVVNPELINKLDRNTGFFIRVVIRDHYKDFLKQKAKLKNSHVATKSLLSSIEEPELKSHIQTSVLSLRDPMLILAFYHPITDLDYKVRDNLLGFYRRDFVTRSQPVISENYRPEGANFFMEKHKKSRSATREL